MAYGIVIRNSAGQIVLDNNERIARQVGYFNTGTSNGSRVFDTGGGQLAYILLGNFSVLFDGPTFTISGGTLSWTFSSLPTAVDVLVLSF